MTRPRALRLQRRRQRDGRGRRDPRRRRARPLARSRSSASPGGTRSRPRRSPTGAPIRKFGQIIGFASKPIEVGQWVHEHNCVVHEFSRDYRFCEDARPTEILPVERQATFQGYRRADGKAGTRNYLGDHDLGELLGDRGAADRARGRAFRHARRLSPCRRRHRARPRRRLRHGLEGRRLRHARAHAVGLRRQSQHGRRFDGRARLRGVPDRPDEGRARPEGGRPLPEPDDPGQRRHAQGGRSGARAHQGDAADRRSRPARDAAGERTDAGAAMRRLGRLFGHHRQSGAGRGGRHAGAGTAARRSCRRPRKSTAPSIC